MLVGHGSNDSLWTWERVKWTVCYSHRKDNHQRLQPVIHPFLSLIDAESVIVSTVYPVHASEIREKSKLSVLTRLLCSLRHWRSLNWLNGWRRGKMVECMTHFKDMVWRGCERASWVGSWEGIIRRKWEGFKELYEIFVVTDERWECVCKWFHEVGNTVWELVGGAITYWQYWLWDFFFFWLGFTPSKDEQPLQGM